MIFPARKLFNRILTSSKQSEGVIMKRIGLIDIGSNTIRLVVFEYDKETGLSEIQNIKTPARLSQYLEDDLTMNQEGIDVLIDSLESFKKVADAYKVDELHPIATAAIRQSKNRDDILKQTKKKLGIKISIVPELDEAFYGFYAIINSTDIENGLSVDIGGGSTEVTLFKDKELIHSHSFPFGVVTLTRKFFGDKAHDDKDAIKKMQKFLEKEFSALSWINNQKVALVGVGGSARNTARIHQSEVSYPIGGVHCYSMSGKDLDQVFALIKESSRDDLTNLDGLSRDRVDIILPAVAVFKALFKQVDATQFTFSRKGLREGYVMNHLNQKYPDAFDRFNVQDRALYQLSNAYKHEQAGAEQRVVLARDLLEQLTELDTISLSDKEKRLFEQAAYVYYLGRFIDSDSGSQHTYYIISNSMIDGFNHHDRVKLAMMASFKNKSLLKFYNNETGWLDSDELSDLQSLGGIIKFIDALNVSHTNPVKRVELEKKDKDHYILNAFHTDNPIAEEYQANRQKKHLEKVLKAKVSINFTKS
ncbi:putative exopolyphosphatase [Staphylococcus piscifermentans]|uniref:exopolyphosphatase n=1 Tax=Staphylococcus piscifermentans TaxID=70258 RepID=A0A239TQC7_9STAP|nr:exopolyphosphatase [Staphylococcus piscifermentans]GEP84466.1 exopolyphosphatase [Staphylococcus piscifermentans]SNU99034.1 putative exopolyphosphatase [Staphylococcus piscifermentans]